MMRYKAYLQQGTVELYNGPVLIKQGTNFVDAQFPGISDHYTYRTSYIALTKLTNCREIKDGIWIQDSKLGNMFIVPESNEFFNVDVFLSEVYVGYSGASASKNIVKRLAIKYFNS